MEFVEGANLHDMIHTAGLEPAQALALTEQVCTALAYAHGKASSTATSSRQRNGRSRRPGQGRDFGLARLTDPAAAEIGTHITGTVMGTPDYMAPSKSAA